MPESPVKPSRPKISLPHSWRPIAARSLGLALLMGALLPISLPAQPPAIDRTLWPNELTEFTPAAFNPVFQGTGVPGSWEMKIRERGWIERGPDHWRLWYTGFDGEKTTPRHLGLAISPEGFRWTRFPGNPVIGSTWGEDPCLAKTSTGYVMLCEGKEDQMQKFTSLNGEVWTHGGRVDIRLTNGDPIAPGPYGTPTLWHEEGANVWWLFYERRDAGLWAATSDDLQIWKHITDEPVLKPGSEGFDTVMIAGNQIFRHGGRYYLVYHGSPDTQAPRRWAVGLASSVDLRHWEKFPGNPLRPLEENKSSGMILHDGLKYRLYTTHDRVDVHWNP